MPADYLRNQDPLDVLHFADTVGPDMTALIERELTRAEVKAAATAEATHGVEAFRAACRSTGRIEAGLASDVWTIGYANKPGKDEAMRDARADTVVNSMVKRAQLTERTGTP